MLDYLSTFARHFLFNQVYTAAADTFRLRNGKVTANCGQLFSRYLQIEQRNQTSEHTDTHFTKFYFTRTAWSKKPSADEKTPAVLTGKLQNRSDD